MIIISIGGSEVTEEYNEGKILYKIIIEPSLLVCHLK
jgi:hypothetical protein